VYDTPFSWEGLDVYHKHCSFSKSPIGWQIKLRNDTEDNLDFPRKEKRLRHVYFLKRISIEIVVRECHTKTKKLYCHFCCFRTISTYNHASFANGKFSSYSWIFRMLIVLLSSYGDRYATRSRDKLHPSGTLRTQFNAPKFTKRLCPQAGTLV